MRSIERAGFLAHAQTAALNRKLEQSENIVRRWLDSCEHPYVAFSGGKDSTVCLDLVRRIADDIPAVFSHDEWLLPETEEFVAATENVHKVANIVQHASWFTAWEDGPKSLPDDVEWLERKPSEGWATWKLGYDGAAIGIRADENPSRKAHIRALGTCFYVRRHRQWQCYPLAWWRDRDVWAYIVSRKLEYNRAYDVLAGMDVPLSRRRIGPLAVESSGPHDPLHMGQLAVLRQGWPDLFNRFAERYPEARRYV